MADRRTILRGLAAATALAVPVGAAMAQSIPDAGHDIAGLWNRLLLAKGRSTAIRSEYDAAYAKLPWWAANGPARVNCNGEFSGPEVGWPAIQDYGLPTGQGVYRRIRVSRDEILDLYEAQKGFCGAHLALQHRDRSLKAFEEREAAQKAEYDRLGLDILSAQSDVAADDIWNYEKAIRDLAPTTLDVTAAQVMIEAVFCSYTHDTTNGSEILELAGIALRGLLPHLSGEIAVDASEFVNTSDRRADELRAWRGILPA